MEIELDWDTTRQWTKITGYLGFLWYLRSLAPELDLYKVSTDWFQEPGFIAKAKGTNGDMIVRWKGTKMASN